jgi:hypothetical protein
MDRPLALLVWYQVASNGDVGIPLQMTRRAFIAALDRLGIDSRSQIPELRSTDAFVAASAGISDTYQLGKTSVLLEVRKGKSDTESVMRHIYLVRTIGNRSEAKRVADLHFYRPRRTSAGRVHGTERLRSMISPTLEPDDRAHVELLIAKITQRYDQRRFQITGQQLRCFLREQMIELNGGPLSDTAGSTYLVPPERADRLQDIGLLVAEAGAGCVLHFAPVPDVPAWRRALIESLDHGYRVQAKEIRATLSMTIRGTLGPSRERFERLRGQALALQERMIWCADRYDAAFPTAAEAFEQTMDAFADILDRYPRTRA